MQDTYGQDIKLQDLTVEDGRDYMRSLMAWNMRYQDHPLHNEENGKLKVLDIYGLGWAIHSFSTWANEVGYLVENVMRRLKLPPVIGKKG